MSVSNPRQTLFEWYDKYVGEAASKREVYGYWTFVVGYVVGVAGVLVYLLGPGPGSAMFFQVREVAIVLSAIGLSLSLLGIVFQLPVRTAGIRAATLGGVVALAAVAFFVTVYPQQWLQESGNRLVIALYLVGVGLIAGVAVLVPVLTGERSFLLDERLEDDGQAIMVGEAEQGGLFAVFRSGPADWRWRLLEQNAVADGVTGYASRPDVETVIDDVKGKVREAGLLEIKHAAFRLYEDDGFWRWLLMEEDGTAVATSAEEYPDRNTAEESVSALKEYGPHAEVVDIEGAAFDVERVGTDWEWRLLDEDRESLAAAPEPLDEREDVDVAVQRFRAESGGTDVLAMDHLGFEVRDEDDGWRWRLVDRTDAEVAAGTETVGTRNAVRERIDGVRADAADAPVVDASSPAFELVSADGGDWSWRLVDGEDVIARNHGDAASRETAEDSLTRLRDRAGDAVVVEGEDAAFEVVRLETGWQWRLVDEDRAVVASATDVFESREAAEEAVEHVVTESDVAELVEFEKAAFQLYEADEGGEWRWRLIDEGGSVMADSGEDYGSRDAAASSMTVLKENAPDADLLEIEDSAIELFRNEAGDWGWRLVDEVGTTIAEGDSRHDSKAAAKAATETFRGTADAADVRVIEEGAFQLYERADEEGAAWRWRFVAAEGDVVADGVAGHTTRDGVTRAVAAVRDGAPGSPIHDVTSLAFVLTPETSGWRWRLVDRDREVLAESSAKAPDHEAVRDAVELVRQHAADAEIFELREPVYRVRERDDGSWEWELIDEHRRAIASGPQAYTDRAAAEAAITPVRTHTPDAGVLEYENAAFELFEDDTGWRWRLIDEDGGSFAESAAEWDDRAAAKSTLETVRAVVAEASMLEIETSAFELHEGEDGWRWRLVDRHGNTVAESVRSYPSRTDARDGMNALKEHAPDAGLVVAG